MHENMSQSALRPSLFFIEFEDGELHTRLEKLFGASMGGGSTEWKDADSLNEARTLATSFAKRCHTQVRVFARGDLAAARGGWQWTNQLQSTVNALGQEVAASQNEGLQSDRLPGVQRGDLLDRMLAELEPSDAERLSRLEAAVQRLDRGHLPAVQSHPVAEVPGTESGPIPAADLAGLATLCCQGCTVSYARGQFLVWRGSPPALLGSHADAFEAVQLSWLMGEPGRTIPPPIQRALELKVMRRCKRCKRMIPPERRMDAKYCEPRCKSAASREPPAPQSAQPESPDPAGQPPLAPLPASSPL